MAANQHRKNKRTFFGRPVWQNSTKTIKVTPQRYYQPQTLEDVIEMVQEGIDTGTPVRAVGSGHSFSPAPKAEGILIETDKLNQLEAYDQTSRSGHYFEVMGGIKLHALNKQLDSLGYCIPTMGGIDHQSIAGAISTGTHGSSLEFGAMSQMVKSIVLVTHDLQDPTRATSYRIERTGPDSFTDPNGYTGPELLLDDDAFRSAVLCFGTMGIIFSYVLEVNTMYYLLEKKEMMNWSQARQLLQQGDVLSQHRSVFVQINPYIDKGPQQALMVYHDLVADPDRNLYLESLRHRYWHSLRRSTRAFQFELASRFQILMWFMVWRINHWPGIIPRFLNSSLKSQRDEEYLHKGHKVMYQGLDYIKERAFDTEIALEMDGSNTYLDTLEDLMEYLRQLRENYKIHLTSPIGLRFVKGSDAFLAPESGRDVCYVDNPVLLHIYGRDTIISRVQQFLLARDGLPHWGKLNYFMDADYVKAHYPHYQDFMTTMKRFNPSGIFSNIFSKRVLGN